MQGVVQFLLWDDQAEQLDLQWLPLNKELRGFLAKFPSGSVFGHSEAIGQAWFEMCCGLPGINYIRNQHELAESVEIDRTQPVGGVPVLEVELERGKAVLGVPDQVGQLHHQ